MTRPLLAFSILAGLALLLVACGGGSRANVQALATEAANVQPQTELTLVADKLKFDTKTIVVSAGRELSITLDNRDSALHNLAVYEQTADGRTEVFRGDLFSGRETRTYTFTVPAGVYLFRCDAHPDMDGAFVAK